MALALEGPRREEASLIKVHVEVETPFCGLKAGDEFLLVAIIQDAIEGVGG